MTRALNIRYVGVVLLLGMILAGCSSASSAATPQPGAAIPLASAAPAARTEIATAAATAAATPAAQGTPVPSDGDIAATIVAAPSAP